MKKITWTLDTDKQGGELSGEIEVEDIATTAEIEAAVREDMWDHISLTWWESMA
jgi:hypothetical protein